MAYAKVLVVPPRLNIGLEESERTKMLYLLWILVIVEGAAIVYLFLALHGSMDSVRTAMMGLGGAGDKRMDRMTARLRRLEFRAGLEVMKDSADGDGEISVHTSELEPMRYNEYTDPDLFGVTARKNAEINGNNEAPKD
jgi:hypothetical protein